MLSWLRKTPPAIWLWCAPETIQAIDTYCRARMTFRNEAANALILARIGQPIYKPLPLLTARRYQFTLSKDALETLDKVGPSHGEAFRALIRRYQ